MSTGWPRSDDSVTRSPSKVSRSISGASLPKSGWPPTAMGLLSASVAAGASEPEAESLVSWVGESRLLPRVAMVSFVGIYGISGSSFDLLVMVGFGVLGWVLRKLDVPLVPIILGTLLGNAMENNLRRAVTIDNGNWLTLFDSPLAIGLWMVAIVGFILPLIVGRKVKAKMHASRDEEGSISD